MMRWGENVTLKFVQIYLKHECLWNPVNPNYKIKYQRVQAYADIIREFRARTTKHLTVPEVKIKIKNLRSTYSQQVYKILKKSTPVSMYRPTLLWFNLMDDCFKHLPVYRHNYHGHSSTQSQLNSICQDLNEYESEAEIHEKTVQLSLEPSDALESTEENNQIVSSEANQATDFYYNKKIKREKRKVKRERPSSEYTTEDSDVKKPRRKIYRTQDDEFEVYGKYIALQLRKMNLRKALRLQLEIQSLISEARISDT